MVYYAPQWINIKKYFYTQIYRISKGLSNEAHFDQIINTWGMSDFIIKLYRPIPQEEFGPIAKKNFSNSSQERLPLVIFCCRLFWCRLEFMPQKLSEISQYFFGSFSYVLLYLMVNSKYIHFYVTLIQFFVLYYTFSSF